MPRAGLAVPRADIAEPESYRFEAERMRRRAESRRGPAQGHENPARRTVTITGHGAEAYTSRNGTRPSTAQRHRGLKAHEREGFRPDRVAMWAFLFGLLMILLAAASSHAAVLAAHHSPLH